MIMFMFVRLQILLIAMFSLISRCVQVTAFRVGWVSLSSRPTRALTRTGTRSTCTFNGLVGVTQSFGGKREPHKLFTPLGGKKMRQKSDAKSSYGKYPYSISFRINLKVLRQTMCMRKLY